MLNNGICRRSESPWNSPVILVTKKDGSTRFVIDYRALNSVNEKDAYPIPDPHDIKDRLSGDQMFPTLDCCCAYWAVALEEEYIPKTAFSTPRGHFEMVRMAFGLCNSQATYQRVIDKALRGAKRTESYIDDILVHSSQPEQHISSLRQVIERLREVRNQLRADKCRLGFFDIEFLGRIITPMGHRPSPHTVARIANYQAPRDKKGQLRIFGLVNFYREYIPGFSDIAEPLYQLRSMQQVGNGILLRCKLSPHTNST